jgi:hypothetical protein
VVRKWYRAWRHRWPTDVAEMSRDRKLYRATRSVTVACLLANVFVGRYSALRLVLALVACGAAAWATVIRGRLDLHRDVPRSEPCSAEDGDGGAGRRPGA